MNIQKTLDALQPYVIGIRYLEGTPLVDVIFKEGWTVPEDAKIKIVKGNDEMNYYMLFSEITGIGLDELLIFVEKTIKLNLEREKKQELLRFKVNELKEVFKKNSLTKLQNLKFTFSDDDLVPKLNDFDDDLLDEPIQLPKEEPQQSSTITIEPEIQEESIKPISYLDENQKPVELTDEDREILEEEARAERNRKMIEAQKDKKNKGNNMSKKVELPPKRKIEMAVADVDRDYEPECDYGPNNACPKCIDSKGY